MTDSQIIARCLPHTSVGPARLGAWIADLRQVLTAGVQGDIVEAGVWKGGCIAAACLVLQDLGLTDRRVWAYDTFAGMTPPGPLDIDMHGATAIDLMSIDPPGTGVWAHSSHVDFFRAVSSTGAHTFLIQSIAGDILHTTNHYLPHAIAALRIDLDWHALVSHALHTFAPLLSTGSAPIHIDDYGHWQGARAATDAYAAAHHLVPVMIDYTGARLIPT